MGSELLSLQLVDPRLLPSRYLLLPAQRWAAIWYPPAFDTYARKGDEQYIPRRIEVSDHDAARFGCNAVCIGASRGGFGRMHEVDERPVRPRIYMPSGQSERVSQERRVGQVPDVAIGLMGSHIRLVVESCRSKEIDIRHPPGIRGLPGRARPDQPARFSPEGSPVSDRGSVRFRDGIRILGHASIPQGLLPHDGLVSTARRRGARRALRPGRSTPSDPTGHGQQVWHEGTSRRGRRPGRKRFWMTSNARWPKTR